MNCQVICADYLESNHDRADLALFDPPYNVGMAYDVYSDSRPRCQYFDWVRAMFDRIKLNSHVQVVTPGIANLGEWLKFAPPVWVCAWHKPASSGRCPMGFTNWEPLLVYGKPQTQICDVIRTTEQAGLAVNHKKYPINHPCPKPVELGQKLIRAFCAPGGLVVDPCCGSASFGVAAKRERRGYVGYDVSAEYVELSQARIDFEPTPKCKFFE